MIKIWHKELMDRGNFQVDKEGVLQQSHYRHVADIDTDDLEKAFELSNHISTSWYINPGVKMHTTYRVRSSSVGDVFERDGLIWEIASFGFYPSIWSGPIGKAHTKREAS